MRRTRLAAVFLAIGAVSLAACGERKVIKVSATSHEVAIRHTPDHRQQADRLAAATCAEYDRRARLRNRHDQYAAMDQFGIYDCVPN